MSNILSSDFPLPSDAYLAFDGLSIKDKIKDRLTQTGIFTDQNYEGSNLSALNDVIAMVFSLLIYNLNRTANEGQFSTSQIYENINRIVKQLDYKPIGHQTSTLAFNMSAGSINAGIYTIPRFTSITTNGIKFSFTQDIPFNKTLNYTTEEITSVENNNLLFQGTFIEYPTYTAGGNDNELVYLTINDTFTVDNFNIYVYVYSQDQVWTEWTKTQSLYLNKSQDLAYEVRFNENRVYELKFGNNINGKRLMPNDLVAIYYLKSDGVKGEIAANSLGGQVATTFNSVRYNAIINDTNSSNGTYLTNTNGLQFLSFNNFCNSSNYNPPETVEEIRTNAPGLFRSQYSLTTSNSYTNYVKTNFSNIVQDVVVKNNSDYLNGYIKYFYDLGLTQPQLESRALFNQLRMADACNFNNVYIFVVPKSINNNLGYLYPAQKSLISNSMQEQKTLTSEIIICDPVYLSVDFALNETNTTSLSDVNNTQIFIESDNASMRNPTSIVADVNVAILNYFNRSKTSLGQTIDINSLTNTILGINGVKKIYTKNITTGYLVEGLRMLMWNPIYGDMSAFVVVGNTTVEDFQFPYLFSSDLTNRITVDSSFSKFQQIII